VILFFFIIFTQVYGAYYFGVKLLARIGRNLIKVEILNYTIEIKILAFFEFTNTRKRTSVLCYLETDETLKWTSSRYILFTKVIYFCVFFIT
jgi:magnesium-transporting ATPase (P-type)